MPRDAQGVYSRRNGTRTGPNICVEEAANPATINAPQFDIQLNDIADALTASLPRDGSAPMTGDLDAGTNKVSNVGDAAAAGDAPNYGQVLDLVNQFLVAAQVGGTGDAIVLTPSPAIAAYEVGHGFRFYAKAANTGPVTVAVSGLAPVSLRRVDGGLMQADDISAGRYIEIVNNGTSFASNVIPPQEEMDSGVSLAEVQAQIRALVFDAAEEGNTDAFPATKIPDLDAAKIATGRFELARIPALDASRIPALGAGQISSGVFARGRLGTGVPSSDLSEYFVCADGTYRRPFEGIDFLYSSSFLAQSSGYHDIPLRIGDVIRASAQAGISIYSGDSTDDADRLNVPVADLDFTLVTNEPNGVTLQGPQGVLQHLIYRPR